MCGTVPAMNPYVILMRGINVGGKNKVSMAKLRRCLEEQGFENVKTYLNSGNVLLESKQSPRQIASRIEDMLPAKFTLDSSIIKVLAFSHDDLQAVIDHAPKRFGTEPDKYHCDAIFLMGISPEDALPAFAPREGVDRIWPGDGVIYSQRLSTQRTKSRLSKIVGTPTYKNMTIRSWTTTRKLLELLEERKAAQEAQSR
jgi:uncharacterized protein (DUF1697 family)